MPSNTLVYVYASDEAQCIACAHINLQPTTRKELDHGTTGRPILLVEERGFVVAGVFLIDTSLCTRIRRDSHCINLRHLCQSYQAICDSYLKYHKQLVRNFRTHATASGNELKQVLSSSFGKITIAARQRLVTEWISTLEPHRRSKYGSYHGQRPHESQPSSVPPWWPKNIRYLRPAKLNISGTYRKID